jgi:hypothetical protein
MSEQALDNDNSLASQGSKNVHLRIFFYARRAIPRRIGRIRIVTNWVALASCGLDLAGIGQRDSDDAADANISGRSDICALLQQ